MSIKTLVLTVEWCSAEPQVGECTKVFRSCTSSATEQMVYTTEVKHGLVITVDGIPIVSITALQPALAWCERQGYEVYYGTFGG